MIIEVNAKFPIAWGAEYYSIGCKEKNVFEPCEICDSTGKVEIKGQKFTCPECKGDWREKKVIAKANVYYVKKWRLDRIEAREHGVILIFAQSGNKYCENLKIRQADFGTMRSTSSGYSSAGRILSNDYKTTMAEVKRLNAEEKKANHSAT